MNAKKSTLGSTRAKHNIGQLVKITATVVIVMFVLYFVVTLNNMSNISHRIEDRKDGAYPVSIAAGHVETDLSQILSIMKVIAVMDSVSPGLAELPDASAVQDGESVLAESSAATHTFHFETVHEDVLEIVQNMRGQISEMMSNQKTDPDNIVELSETYSTLEDVLVQAFDIWSETPGNRTAVQSYIASDVIPVLEHALQVDNAILDTTTDDIEDVYISVLDSIQQTVIFSLLLIIATFLAMFIYIALLNRKEIHEAELSNHLKDALAVAQSANAAKSSFLSNMSHDIRTPLNAIIGLTVIAEDNMDDPVRLRQCLGQITTSSNHLLQLINDVLDMNRIESGKTIIASEVFSIPEMMAELSTINETQIAEKGLHAQFELESISHEYVLGDPTRIRQILLNLTSNAIKYTRPGDSLKVVFSEIAPVRQGCVTLKMTVADTGIGMQEDFLQYIFEPFERERNQTTNFTEGTGLGMAITKNLVTMMGGTISVESQPDEGTTFTVVLPLAVAEDVPDLSTAKYDGVRILVIDDSKVSLDAICAFLETFRMDVRPVLLDVGDLPRFRQILAEEIKDAKIVLEDINTKDMTSRARAEGIIRNAVEEKGVPLILAADRWRAMDKEVRKAGITAFIERPIFRSRLHETVGEVLDVAVEKPAAEDESSSSAKQDGNLSGRVLIVEDNELNMEIATELIKKMGPQVEQAGDGVEAVEMVQNAPEGYYSLIFMDWQMPRMNGIDATKALVKFFQEEGLKPTPIVAMTANAFNDNRREALAAGMEDFMAKPINVQELKEILAKYL